jgi:hypothetical protein
VVDRSIDDGRNWCETVCPKVLLHHLNQSAVATSSSPTKCVHWQIGLNDSDLTRFGWTDFSDTEVDLLFYEAERDGARKGAQIQ